MAITYIKELYQHDNQWGDGFLHHQRKCIQQLSLLYTQPLESKWDCALRVGKFALLVFPTLLACIEGIIGVAVKAAANIIGKVTLTRRPATAIVTPLQQTPLTITSLGVFPLLENFDEPIVANVSANLIKELPIEEEGTSPVEILHDDLLIHIGQLLAVKTLGKLQKVSKKFNTIFRSPILWSKHLANENIRLWGGTAWTFTRIDEGYQYASQDTSHESNPYGQLVAYSHLDLTDTFMNIARLMKGGPLAFQKLQHLEIDSINCLEALMTASFAWGKLASGKQFLALKVVRTDIENSIPELLVFVESNERRFQSTTKFLNVANSLWEAGKLSLNNDKVLYYIKDLISDNPVTESQDFLGINRNIALFKPRPTITIEVVE